MKLEYIVVYENISDKFDIGHSQTKVKVIVGLQNFSPFTTIQTVRSHDSTLVQAGGLGAYIKHVCSYDTNNLQRTVLGYPTSNGHHCQTHQRITCRQPDL